MTFVIQLFNILLWIPYACLCVGFGFVCLFVLKTKDDDNNKLAIWPIVPKRLGL